MTSTLGARRLLPTLAGLALATSLAAGCAVGSSDDSSGGSSSDAESTEQAPQRDGVAGDVEADAGGRAAVSDEAAADPTSAEQAAIISTGRVELTSDDVGAARDAVRDLVDDLQGTVADERTRTGEDDDGEPVTDSARLVLRVPAAEFDAAVEAVEAVAEVRSSETTAEDVTTEVIDVESRLRAQERSIRRIEVLLDQAEDLGQIVRIEGELTERQANLDSLEQQRAYLADQTSLSTLTVLIDREGTAPPADDDEQSGFLGGLARGWAALAAAGSALATATGVLLPWLVVLLVLAVPLRILARRLRGRWAGQLSPGTGPAPRPAAPAE